MNTLQTSRRDFLKLFGATVAAASLPAAVVVLAPPAQAFPTMLSGSTTLHALFTDDAGNDNWHPLGVIQDALLTREPPTKYSPIFDMPGLRKYKGLPDISTPIFRTTLSMLDKTDFEIGHKIQELFLEHQQRRFAVVSPDRVTEFDAVLQKYEHEWRHEAACVTNRNLIFSLDSAIEEIASTILERG
jgi:hypothetical protein